MKLLDELKKQSTKILKHQNHLTENNEVKDILLHADVEQKLHQIHDYLTELIEHIRIIQPEIQADRFIDQLGKIEHLFQSNYRVFSETTYDKLTVGITFILSCMPHCNITEVSVENENRLFSKLQKLGLDITSQEAGNIEVEGKFPASLVFSSSRHRDIIKFSINNIEFSDSLNYAIPYSEFSDELIDEIGNLLLRKENNLVKLAEELDQSDSSALDSSLNIGKEPTLTELMDFPMMPGIFKDNRQMYLTYREDIHEVTSNTGRIILGRGGQCDMKIPSDFASRQHALIAFRRGKFVVTDHSTNGTFIKPQGNQEVYIHGEDYPLTGSGFISLGASTNIESEHLIYFSCQ